MGVLRREGAGGGREPILQCIAGAISRGEVTDGDPLVVEGADCWGLLGDLTYDFAERLKACTNEDGDNGWLLTFHRKLVPLAEDDNVEADGIADEAGAVYASPDVRNLLKNPELPLPEDVIACVKIRVAVARMGVPRKSDYDVFKALEAEGELGFGHLKLGMIKPDAMVVATCQDGKWTRPMVVPYAELGFSPNMQALHYGGAEFEGMTAEIGVDGNVYVFGMKEHYERYRNGAIKQGIEYVSYDVFHESIIKAVQQNARFIPARGKGRLYIRQHAADIGPQMRVGNSRVSGFFVEVTPIGAVGAYFGAREERKEGENVPMKVMGVPIDRVRAAEGQGSVKAVGNYARTPPVIEAVRKVNLARPGEKAVYPDGVLYLDRIVVGRDFDSEEFESARVCETNASNTLFVQNLPNGKYRIVAPTLEHGDILPGNTRMLIIEKARELDWEVEERDVTVGELKSGVFDAAFNCGTAAMISPVDAIHFLHISERGIGQDLYPNIPKVLAGPLGELITIRDQAAVNEEPMPQACAILLEKLLAVKSGASGDEDIKRYLTRVPGLRARVAD